MLSDSQLVAVYADESCLGNGQEGDNPGGAGAVLEYRQPRGAIERRDVWISEPSTTNNRMALRSVIDTFRVLNAKGRPCRVVFTSDSRYLIDGLSDWVFGWAARGWVRKGGAIENLALWHQAIEMVRDGGHEVAWRWVRGHTGHPQNEYANHLATRAAADQSQSGGAVPSGFDDWLATQARLKPLAAFPDTTAFAPARELPPAPSGRR